MTDITEASVAFGDAVEERARALARHISESDIPGLNPLVQQRRRVYAIIDQAFRMQPAYDKILVRQIHMDNRGERFSEDSPLYMPKATQRRARDEAARGVIVSAGPKAMDILASNAMDVGHIITHIKNAPWRLPIATIDGIDEHLLVLNVGDIIASEDTRRAIERGDLEMRYDESAMQHYYYDTRAGKRLDPTEPWIPEDY